MAILLNYDLETDFNPSTQASGLSGGALTNASLSSFVRDTLAYGTGTTQGLANPPASTTTAALAVTNNSYFSFTATPTAGFSISLTSLTFKMARGGAATPRGYAVRSSADGYASNLATADIVTQRTTFTDVSVDLSGVAFQGLSSAITFRIYVYAPANTNSLDFDDVVLNGSVSAGGSASLSPSASKSPSASASLSKSPSASLSPSASKSPSSSVSPSSIPSGLPDTPVALYWVYWAPIYRLVNLPQAYNIITLFHAPGTGGGNVNLIKPSGTIGTNLNADIVTCRARGQKILVSIGGAGGAVGLTSQATADTLVASIKSMNLGLGSGTGQTANFDGIDFNNFEGGGSDPVWMTYVALRLKEYYGSSFICTSPPAPWGPSQNTSDRLVLATMHRGGTYGSYSGTGLDWLCPQFYDPDCNNTQALVRDQLDFYHTAVTVPASTVLGTSSASVQIPRSKIGIGFSCSAGGGNGLTCSGGQSQVLKSTWSPTGAANAYQAMLDEGYEPRGAFNWTDDDDYPHSIDSFASTVAPVILNTGSASMSPSASKSPSSSASASRSPSASTSPSSSASTSVSRSLSPSSSASRSASSSSSRSDSPSASKSPSASVSASQSSITTVTVSTDFWGVTFGEVSSPSPSVSPSFSASRSLSPSASLSTSPSASPTTWTYKTKHTTNYGYKTKHTTTWTFKYKHPTR